MIRWNRQQNRTEGVDVTLSKLNRRSLLAGVITGTAGAAAVTQQSALSASSSANGNVEPGENLAGVIGTTPTVLLAYFSRAGENYYYGGRTILERGNTEVLVEMIVDRLACDIYRIEPADPYPEDYDRTVARNAEEQQRDARPAISTPLDSIGSYNAVLLASPIWNVRAPMIMSSFATRFDFSGKTVLPITTHAMSGLGRTARHYAEICPGAAIGEGLAVQGEEVTDAGPAIDAWLRKVDLIKR